MPDLEPASALARRICAGPGAYESDDQDRADWEAEIRERDAAVREEALREAVALVQHEVDKFRSLAADSHDETRRSMNRDATTLRIYAVEPLEKLLTEKRTHG